MLKGARLLGVAGLCVLSGSAWLLAQAWPSEMAWPFGSCLHFALIGTVGVALVVLRGEWRGLPWRRIVAPGLAGMCLFAVPSAVLQLTAGKVPEYTSAALFCAVPLVTILASSALAAGEGWQARGLMVPGMMGLAGALLLFPVQSPGSVRRWLYLGLVAACCVLVAVASVLLHRLMHETSVGSAMAAIGLGSAMVLGCYGASVGWPAMSLKMIAGELLRCIVFDLPIIWLTIWLARTVVPARLSARFLLVPLVTVMEGYAVERGPVEARAVFAVVLMAAAAAMLLFKDEPDDVPALRLR